MYAVGFRLNYCTSVYRISLHSCYLSLAYGCDLFVPLVVVTVKYLHSSVELLPVSSEQNESSCEPPGLRADISSTCALSKGVVGLLIKYIVTEKIEPRFQQRRDNSVL